jgi:VWFA-related protein
MMRTMDRKRLITRLVLLAVLARPANPQEAPRLKGPTPTFPARVEQVTVDVVVVDRSGHPVTDLTREGFEIYEDGVRQVIASFDLFQVPEAAPVASAEGPVAASAPQAPSRVSTNATPQDERGRTFVMVFDDVHLTARTAQQAKAAVAAFLRNETREGDRVTLVAASGSVWWTARMAAGRGDLLELLKKVQGRLVPETRRDWISDYEAMRINVFKDNMILNRVQRRFETYNVQTVTEQSQHVRDMMAVEDPVITARANEVYYEATARNHLTLGAMERATNALAPVRGRKSVVLVSDGFIYDGQLPEFKRLIDEARRVNAAFYFVNSRGLEGLPDALGAEYSTALPAEDLGYAFVQDAEATEGASSLAADSGGFTVRNSNDLAAGLKRIADETRAYYLVGYNPTNTAQNGAFRKIEVKVRGRRGLTVRARKGYYAPVDPSLSPPPRPGTDPVFQAALDSPYELPDIPIRMTQVVREETTLDEARVFLAAEVDIRPLGFVEKDGQAHGALQYLLVAVPREGGPISRFDQTLELTLPPDTREELSRTWLPIVREKDLGSGRYRAKIVVRDKVTGKVGTLVHDFEVPDLKPFRISTPVLSDMREGAETGIPGDRLAILARRDFPQKGPLYCQVDVYQAVKEETTGMPRVTMSYEVRRKDGAVLTREASSLIRPTPEGAVSRMIGFSLENASPGEYDLVLRFKDEFSGSRLESREPFRVVSAAPSAPTGQ